MEQNTTKYSIIVPVYNEAGSLRETMLNLSNFLQSQLDNYELIAIDDGSKDDSGQILKSLELPHYSFYQHAYNKGYGAALKSGVLKAHGQFVIFYDGDGQHNPSDILKLVAESDHFDMIIGSRQGYKGPAWRQPGKKIINLIANYLVQFKIPDLNSGLRLVRKEGFNNFLHLYPNGFSLSTTITLAFIKHGYEVKYVPIEIKKRVGKSSVKISDGFQAIRLVLRMIMVFSPLRIFLPIALLFFLLGFLSLVFDIVNNNLTDTTTLLFTTFMMVVFFGLISEQLSIVIRHKR